MSLINHLLNEKHETMLVDISLKEIIDAGGPTNYYHTFLLVNLSTAMPNVYSIVFGKEPDCDCCNEVELTEFIKKMSVEDQVKLAKGFLDIINAKNSCPRPSIDMIDWMRYVIRKQ